MAHQLQSVIPKLPSKDLNATKSFYEEKLGFRQVGGTYPDYLMLRRDAIELHFFLHSELDVLMNYGMCYIRITNIDELYNELQNKQVNFPGHGFLEEKPWKQKEFSIVDADHNLLTFGEEIKR